jgi:hypothetical protein
MTGKVNEELKDKIADFKAINKIPADVSIKQSGQGAQEAETNQFLITAFFYGIGINIPDIGFTV